MLNIYKMLYRLLYICVMVFLLIVLAFGIYRESLCPSGMFNGLALTLYVIPSFYSLFGLSLYLFLKKRGYWFKILISSILTVFFFILGFFVHQFYYDNLDRLFVDWWSSTFFSWLVFITGFTLFNMLFYFIFDFLREKAKKGSIIDEKN